MSEPDNTFPRLMIVGRYSLLEPETLNSDGACSILRTNTRLDAGNLNMTLADTVIDGFLKKISTSAGNNNCTTTLSLDQSGGAYVSFTIQANSKGELIWDNRKKFWRIIDEKNLTKNL